MKIKKFISHKYYIQGAVIIASREGGVNIEDIAATKPEAISYTPIDVRKGLSCEQADAIACSLGVDDVSTVSTIVCNLYEMAMKKDALLLEINPLVQDLCGQCEFFFVCFFLIRLDRSCFNREIFFQLRQFSHWIASATLMIARAFDKKSCLHCKIGVKKIRMK